MASPETPLQDDEPAETLPEGDEPRYVLITECLQNDFVLNSQCRLSLPESVARSVLLGREAARRHVASDGIRRFPAKAVADGPFGQFLDETIGSRMRGEESRGVLHVINIRDWHEPDDNYDFERRRYGTHCEAGTWGAGYVDGLEEWLDPADPLPTPEEARYFEKGSVRIHHVHADSIFDFRPRRTHIKAEERKFRASALEILIDVIAQGSDADQETRAGVLARRSAAARALAARRGDRRRRERSLLGAPLHRRDRLLHRHQGRRSSSPASAPATSFRTSPSPTRSRRARRSNATSAGSTSPRSS